MLDLNNLPQKGKAVIFKHRGAEFQMTILNARIRYNKVDVEISPVAGTGSFWVEYAGLTETDTVGEKLAELAGLNA